ncbi:hypothetical protein [Micromonospora sp. RTP1Z1]|uniref:hypothetical protein n=1 Tax=Micromonospora sp. RTP1Z1 TaxID=2994043 RepID=UPI0029C82BE8|nr:hypothetical protein [Micromonospora sp. RTP1Z1]
MNNVPAAPEVAQQQTAGIVSAAAAGQPALIRIARANMLRAIYRECFAVDRDALPAPRAVRFDPRGSALQLDFDTPVQAQAWAGRLGGLRSARNWAMVGATGYHAVVVWRGVLVDLVAVVPAAVEHRHVGGAGGAPGECSAECACGVTFDGFDTIAEASALLDDHIAKATGVQTSAVPA